MTVETATCRPSPFRRIAHRVAISAVLVWFVGCAALTPYVPVMVQVAETMAELVKKKTGRDINDLDRECDEEYNEEKQKLYVLCVFDLAPSPTGSATASD